jgi:hypothetical protein
LNRKLRVSDIINKTEILSWNNGDIITINAGTGQGKSYFIKNDLYEYAKEREEKILFLIHRANTAKQFRDEIKRDRKAEVIHICTYQSIEKAILNGEAVDLSGYRYICADEFHYFLNDADFNRTTDLSFDYILRQNHATRIFMSATSVDMMRCLENVCNVKIKNYSLPQDFSFINNLTFFYFDNDMEELLRESIYKEEKAIAFIQSAGKAHEIYKIFKDCALFNCSKGNEKYYRYVDADRINEMLGRERFEESLLITTTCFDAGVNIKDEGVKNIIIDVKDVNSLIQCIGRRRILHDNDKINIYIKAKSNRELGGFIASTKQRIAMADYLSIYGTGEFIKKYARQIDNSGMIYDELTESGDSCIKKVNPFMYAKSKLDIEMYTKMIELGKFGYCIKVAEMLGRYNSDTAIYKYKVFKRYNALEEYLKCFLGAVMLQPKDREELINLLNARRNGKQLKSLEALNIALLERGLNYRIIQFETSRTTNGIKKKYKSAWRIEKAEPP